MGECQHYNQGYCYYYSDSRKKAFCENECEFNSGGPVDECLECLGCDRGKENECADCCRDWDNEEDLDD